MTRGRGTHTPEQPPCLVFAMSLPFPKCTPAHITLLLKIILWLPSAPRMTTKPFSLAVRPAQSRIKPTAGHHPPRIQAPKPAPTASAFRTVPPPCPDLSAPERTAQNLPLPLGSPTGPHPLWAPGVGPRAEATSRARLLVNKMETWMACHREGPAPRTSPTPMVSGSALRPALSPSPPRELGCPTEAALPRPRAARWRLTGRSSHGALSLPLTAFRLVWFPAGGSREGSSGYRGDRSPWGRSGPGTPGPARAEQGWAQGLCEHHRRVLPRAPPDPTAASQWRDKGVKGRHTGTTPELEDDAGRGWDQHFQ